METAVDLYWIPLGAGEPLPVVRVSGRLYEALAARRAHRPPAALFHAALILRVDDVPWAVEMGPAWKGPHGDRGSVASGPVAARALGRSRYFRYEVRCRPDGVIPDLRFAVGDPCRMPSDPSRARRLLELLRCVPTFTWGRDELRTGDMWNSNSLVAWLLTSSGHDVVSVGPPPGGRAPGWWAGLVLAERQAQQLARGLPVEGLDEPPLAARLGGARVVPLPQVADRVPRRHAVEDGEAGEGGAGAPPTADQSPAGQRQDSRPVDIPPTAANGSRAPAAPAPAVASPAPPAAARLPGTAAVRLAAAGLSRLRRSTPQPAERIGHPPDAPAYLSRPQSVLTPPTTRSTP